MEILKPRRRLIVNREVQYDVLMHLSILVVSLFLAQVLAASLFLYHYREVIPTMSALDFISRFRISFLVYQLIPLTLGLLIGSYIFNRLTSRIAGPLYNMKRILHSVDQDRSRDLEIKLREDDYFQEEIEDINRVLLKRRIK
ncbi:MAG: HAMP domain-containing protein [Bdellovibrio sp.]